MSPFEEKDTLLCVYRTIELDEATDEHKEKQNKKRCAIQTLLESPTGRQRTRPRYPQRQATRGMLCHIKLNNP